MYEVTWLEECDDEYARRQDVFESKNEMDEFIRTQAAENELFLKVIQVRKIERR